jgi:hypothetical protein
LRRPFAGTTGSFDGWPSSAALSAPFGTPAIACTL